MRDNDWMTVTDVDDFECPPSGKSLTLRAPSLDIELRSAFSIASRDELRELYLRIGSEGATGSQRRHEEWIKAAEAPRSAARVPRD